MRHPVRDVPRAALHAGLFESIPLAALYLSRDLRVLAANPAACELLRSPQEDLLGERISQVMQIEGDCLSMLEEVEFPAVTALRTGENVRGVQLPFRVGPQRVLWLETSAFFQEVETSPGELLVTLTDVTELLDARRELQLAEAKFHALFHNNPIGVAYHRMVYDEAGAAVDYYFIDANEHYQTLTGVNPVSQLVTRAFPGIEKDPFDWIGTFGHVAKTGKMLRFEQYLETVDRWYDVVAYRTSPGHFVAAFIEVTERKRAELALLEREQQLRATMDSMGEGLLTTDAEGRVRALNRAASRVLGVEESEVRHLPLDEVYRVRTPKDGEWPLRAQGAEKKHQFALLRQASGEEVPIEFTREAILRAGGEEWGEVIAFREMSEELKLQEQLVHAQKMESIGSLAGGVAHDFNNMLMGILGAAEILGQDLSQDPEHFELVHLITSTAENARKLTRQLLDFARKGKIRAARLDVDELAKSTADLLRVSVQGRARVELAQGAQGSVILGDSAQLENALLNLGINARDAMPGGGRITISTGKREVDAAQAQALGLQAGPHVEICVRDEGEGMTEEVQRRAFDPFFTTKSVGVGTGLGLAAVHGAVHSHRGAIELESEVGKGTTFRLLFPQCLEPGPPRSTGASRVSLPDGLRVLVVDDEASLRRMASQVLRDQGAVVTEARDGQEALEVFERAVDAFDVVLLDVVMPRRDGVSCFAELRRLNPNLRVIMASGYAQEANIEALFRDGLVGFLRKPYRGSALLRSMAQSLADSCQGDAPPP